MRGDINLSLRAPLYGPTGYSNLSRSFLKSLVDLTDIRIRINIFVEWGNIPGTLLKEEEALLERLSRVPLEKRYINLVIHMPDLFIPDGGALANIGLTMFETDSIPSQWPSRCNGINEVWNPSLWGKGIFEECGCNNVKHIPPIVDPSIFKPGESLLLLKADGIEERKEGYCFLTNADWTSRKNIEGLLRAYFQEFKHNEPVTLLLKVFHINPTQITKMTLFEKITKIKKEMGLTRTPKVIIFGDMLKLDNLPKLYNYCDCYISASHGEGFNLPAVEAGLCEKAIVSTNATAMGDYLTHKNAYIIPARKWVHVDPEMERITPNYRGMKWVKVAVRDIAKQMRRCYSEKGGNKGKIIRKELIEKYSPQVVVPMIVERLRYYWGRY